MEGPGANAGKHEIAQYAAQQANKLQENRLVNIFNTADIPEVDNEDTSVQVIKCWKYTNSHVVQARHFYLVHFFSVFYFRTGRVC